MNEIKIAVDAMGSDKKVDVEVNGCMEAIKKNPDIKIILFGDENEIKQYLTDSTNITVCHCSEEIDINSEPVLQLRKKQDASLVKALKAVKNNECSAIVSAGSTGAVISGGLLLVGRIRGIKRPALSPILPSTNNELKVILDIGASDEAKEVYLIQNAKMGIEFAKALGVSNPKVVLLNIGTEPKKGNTIYQHAYKSLNNDAKINFIGNIEGREIITCDANVIVTDGFSGNIALKTLEGTAQVVGSLLKETFLKSLKNKFAALILKNDLKQSVKMFDYHETGGALLVGCKGVIVKAHGSSNIKSFSNAIELAYQLESKRVVEKIAEAI